MPAWNRADSIAATVEALRGLDGLASVVVVDDGSTDGTTDAALAAGATVLRLPANRGKGGAVEAAVAAIPDADVFLLVDADVAATAAAAGRLLGPVLAGDADMTVAVLPGAGRRGGFGLVRRLAAAAIRRAAGWEPRAPLSGQRAVRADLLRSLELAPRFGLETALTIDARRAGARVVEIDVPMEHRHTGRGAAGFRHRAGQGVDVVRAAWPRATPAPARVALVLAAVAAAVAAALWSGARAEPGSIPGTGGARRVVVVGLPGAGWEDVDPSVTPNLHGLAGTGAVATTTVRTLSARPSASAAWATLGAGARVSASPAAAVAVAGPEGSVLVPGAAGEIRHNEGRNLPSLPGALGDALHRAGRRTSVIGDPAAAVALMDSAGVVDGGSVGAAAVADAGGLRAAVGQAVSDADLVLVAPLAPSGPGAAASREALRAADRVLGEVQAAVPPDTFLLAVGVAPAGDEWVLTPMAAAGAGVVPGSLHSPSTRRPGLVAITDVAPTVLAALGVPVPSGMVGHALRYRPGRVDLAALERLNRDAAFRERVYPPVITTYVAFQALAYLLAAVLAARRRPPPGRVERSLRVVVLAVAAFPLATFLFRAIPDVSRLGAAGLVVLLAIDAAVVALARLARHRPLAPLAWILGATVAVLVVDVATGARLQTVSLLGYSPHSAGRFTGLGNTAFAALAASTVLLGALHVHHAPRRREALVTVAALFVLVVVVDGAPVLGSDVGGILTLVPVLSLTLLLLTGRRLSWRAVAVAGVGTLVAVGLATGVDLLRPEASRTHLGRLVGEVRDGGWGVFTTTVARKLRGSMRTYRSPWAWAVPVVTVYMAYVLAWARGWHRLLPSGSALRAGVAGALAVGLLGFAVNDSGVVITAVVFVYLGPLLTLLSVTGHGDPPVLLHPPGVAPSPGGPLVARA